MIDITEIRLQVCGTDHYNDHMYTPAEVDQAMRKALKAAIPLILEKVANKAQTTALYRPNCDDHTPYWGACISCGRTDNPDVIDGSIIDKESITNLEQEILKELGI